MASKKRTDSGDKASADERKLAKFLLLDRIRSRLSWTGSAELKAYVESHCSWSEHGKPEARSRTLDNWLRDLRALSDETGLFEHRREPDNRISYRTVRRDRLSLETACLSLLAQRFLQPLLPLDHVESDLAELFRTARARLVEHDATRGLNGDAASALLERIAILPRGHALGASEAARGIVPVVTGAILKRLCIEASYTGSKRLLHPYGLIFRDPKYYLLAVDDRELRRACGQAATLTPKTYLCSRFESAVASSVRNLVPDDFTLETHLRRASSGFLLRGLAPGEEAPSTLKLRLYDAGRGAFVRDLKDHPIAMGQEIRPSETNASEAILTAPDVRPTIELMNWLMARGDRVEVIEPVSLRRRVADKALATLARYSEDVPMPLRKSA